MRPRTSSTLPRVLMGALVLGAGLLGGVNALAYHHAWSLTHFAAPGPRRKPAEALSLGERAVALFAGVSIPKPVHRYPPGSPGLELETHRFPTTDGLRLEAWVARAPRAPATVALLHGYTDTKASLLPQARAFRDWGYNVVLVDFRGSGGSDGEGTTIGYLEADDVAATARFARQELGAPRLVLYGASMGSVSALRAVGVEKVAADALLIECPFDRLSATIAHRFEMLGVPAFPGAYLLTYWGGRQQGFDAFAHNPVDYAAQVDVPTLLMQGDRDPKVKVSEAQEIFARLRGPKALKVFAGLGHESYFAAQPQVWREAVSAFLETVAPARPPRT